MHVYIYIYVDIDIDMDMYIYIYKVFGFAQESAAGWLHAIVGEQHEWVSTLDQEADYYTRDLGII